MIRTKVQTYYEKNGVTISIEAEGDEYDPKVDCVRLMLKDIMKMFDENGYELKPRGLSML